MTAQEQVAEFHRAFGVPVGVPWNIDLGALRARLIAEECRELGEAFTLGHLSGVAQELADLAYVVFGAAVAFGMDGTADVTSKIYSSLENDSAALAGWLLIGDMRVVAVRLPRVIGNIYAAAHGWGVDLNAAITEVHAANMRKLGPDGQVLRRPDGKILKGPNYTPPDMAKALSWK